MKFELAFLVLALAVHTEAFHDRVPEESCNDMMPVHWGMLPQDSPAPYDITYSVAANVTFEVSICGRTTSDKIKGLMLQARVEDEPVGDFEIAPDDKLVQLMECSGFADTVIHKQHSAKNDRQTVTVTWNPPAKLSGEVSFRATVMLDGNVFWVGVESAPIKLTV